MDSLRQLQDNWEGYAELDPLWAICVDSEKRGNKWTEAEFFETGIREVGRVMQYLSTLGLSPEVNAPALDFGCGVGRLTRALSQFFVECCGVDISSTMIELAREFHRDNKHCNFWLNETDSLSKFQDQHFGFIYTSIVLQHIPKKYARNYLTEFVRVLKPGGILVFQVPDKDRTGMLEKIRNFVGFRARLNRLLGRKNLGTFHMGMHCIQEKEIRRLLSGSRAKIIDVQLTNSTDGSFNGDLKFLDKEPSRGFVSKQYCVIKGAPSPKL